MSNFICEYCGANIIDSDHGYVTGCEHYPMEVEPPRKTSWSVAFNMLVAGFEEKMLQESSDDSLL